MCSGLVVQILCVVSIKKNKDKKNYKLDTPCPASTYKPSRVGHTGWKYQLTLPKIEGWTGRLGGPNVYYHLYLVDLKNITSQYQYRIVKVKFKYLMFRPKIHFPFDKIRNLKGSISRPVESCKQPQQHFFCSLEEIIISYCNKFVETTMCYFRKLHVGLPGSWGPMMINSMKL